MYSEFHPNLHGVWLAVDGRRRLLDEGDGGACPVLPEARRCRTWRSAACLERIARCLRAQPKGARLEIWAPRFDLDTAILSRSPIVTREVSP
jgi:hypothetical protein